MSFRHAERPALQDFRTLSAADFAVKAAGFAVKYDDA
jgi:hypothetical protein